MDSLNKKTFKGVAALIMLLLISVGFVLLYAGFATLGLVLGIPGAILLLGVYFWADQRFT